MARAKVGSGFGASITFGTSAWTACITGIKGPNKKRGAYSTASNSTAAVTAGDLNNDTKVVDSIYDNGEMVIDVLFDPATTPPMGAAIETITITYPIPAGGLTANTAAFDGFCTKWENAVPMNGVMTGTLTVKVSGKITITPGT